MLLKWVVSGDEKQVATLCGMGGDRAGIERKQSLLCEPVSPGSGQQPGTAFNSSLQCKGWAVQGHGAEDSGSCSTHGVWIRPSGSVYTSRS